MSFVAFYVVFLNFSLLPGKAEFVSLRGKSYVVWCAHLIISHQFLVIWLFFAEAVVVCSPSSRWDIGLNWSVRCPGAEHGTTTTTPRGVLRLFFSLSYVQSKRDHLSHLISSFLFFRAPIGSSVFFHHHHGSQHHHHQHQDAVFLSWETKNLAFTKTRERILWVEG